MSTVRERMITSAVRLFQVHGLSATAFADVIRDSETPRGSIYHYFPAGKTQLAEEATKRAAELMTAEIQASLKADDVVDALRRMVGIWRVMLTESDCMAACPMVAAGVAGVEYPQARAAAAEAFAAWHELLTEYLVERELVPRRARRVATLVIASIEGAITLCQSQHTVQPLEDVAEELELLARQTLG